MLLVIDEVTINPEKIVYIWADDEENCTVYFDSDNKYIEFNRPIDDIVGIVNNKGPLLLTEAA